MSRRKACCHKNCGYFDDSFNRADSTDLGSDWTEVEGNWRIFENNLWESGNPEAYVICNEVLEGPRVFLRVYLASGVSGGGVPTTGSTWEIWLNWCKDDPTYYIVRIQKSGTEEVTLGLYNSSAPTVPLEEQVFAHISDDEWPIEVHACLTRKLLMALLNLAMSPSYYCDLTPWVCTGEVSPECLTTQACLANGGSTAIAFDSFHFAVHWAAIENGNPDDYYNCPQCDCDCQGLCMPRAMTAILVDADPGGPTSCAEIDGTQFDLDVFYGPEPGVYTLRMGWRMPEPITLGPFGTCLFGRTFDLNLFCDVSTPPPPYEAPQEEQPEINYHLFNVDDRSDGCDPGSWFTDWSFADVETASCNPLYLKFGPFEVDEFTDDGECEIGCCRDELPSGQVYVVITE